MRTFLIIFVCIGAITFVAVHKSRTHIRNSVMWLEDVPPVEPPPVVRVVRANAPVQKPNFKRTKRTPTKEPGYAFAVTGWGESTDDAKKDAFDQAAKVVTSALELQHTPVDVARLAQMITEAQDGLEVPLGTSDGKDLGPGKQISLAFELPGDFIREMAQKERGYRMGDRMDLLARGLAMIVAGLFAISGYVRLDDWSKGYFSGALKTIAVLTVVGAGAAIYFLR
jgi:hypothetical protein